MNELLRSLPSVDQLAERLGGGPLAVGAARQVIDEARRGLLDGSLSAMPDLDARGGERLAWLARGKLRPVLNATGVVVHTNLGRAPWGLAARDAAVSAMGSVDLEVRLADGSRGGRLDGVEALLRHVTGAQAGLVVNNCAAAVLLALTALAADREVVVSRGELVEIGGSFRVPEVIAACGARLVEVGTTNKTRASDFVAAAGAQTALFLRVHPSNFRQVGFVEAPSRAEMVSEAQRLGLPLLEDLGSGALQPTHDEPSVADVMASGVDLAMFSGDKLLGGPQAGLVVGRRDLVAQLRRHPLYRALRVGKVTLAALEATLVEHAAGRPLPVARQSAMAEDALLRRAEVWAARLRDAGLEATACAAADRVGGGALPGKELPGAACVVQVERVAAASKALRCGAVPVMGRVHDGRLWLHPRTVPEDRDDVLLTQVASVLSSR